MTGKLKITRGSGNVFVDVGFPPGEVSVDIYGAPTPYHGDDSYRSLLEPLLKQDGVRLHGAIAHDRVARAAHVLRVAADDPRFSRCLLHVPRGCRRADTCRSGASWQTTAAA